jgi:hypothetical protein
MCHKLFSRAIMAKIVSYGTISSQGYRKNFSVVANKNGKPFRRTYVQYSVIWTTENIHNCRSRYAFGISISEES